jgi:hypothetical protein
MPAPAHSLLTLPGSPALFVILQKFLEGSRYLKEVFGDVGDHKCSVRCEYGAPLAQKRGEAIVHFQWGKNDANGPGDTWACAVLPINKKIAKLGTVGAGLLQNSNELQKPQHYVKPPAPEPPKLVKPQSQRPRKR